MSETERHAHGHDHGASLTKNQMLVLDALHHAPGPLSAYGILDALRGNGLKAPLQVYRALDKLRDAGLVHRLESLNAFVACRHGCIGEATMAFMICETCGSVAELADVALTADLTALAKASGFTMSRSVIELRGVCTACARA
jgi:Fur family transcriptional regulator, zinc uptake regulator